MMNSGIARFGLEHIKKDVLLADHWQMHPWQAMQILNQIFFEIEQGKAEDELAGKPGWTFEKIRVVEDPHFPMDLIHLRDKDENVLVEFRNVGSADEPK